jgi:thioredoxin
MTVDAETANLREADSESCKAAIEQGGLVLLDFWAQWCAPCRSLEPVLAELAGGRPDLTILKVDIERNGAMADQFAVQSVPMLLLFAGGTCVSRLTGKVSFVEIDRIVARHS